jgi:phosphoglycolate phosphatase
MFPVGVTWGYRTEEELLASGAKMVIKHPSELIQIL